jgi:hypothetical protein
MMRADLITTKKILSRAYGSHLLVESPEAEGAHVGPDFFDVGEAFGFGAGFADRFPAGREVAAGGPDGVLLFFIHDDAVFGFHGLDPH